MINHDQPLLSNEKHSQVEQDLFRKTLIYFLLLYLSLHNLIIPVFVNIYKEKYLLNDVHFWFLFVFFIKWIENKKLRETFILIGILGSCLRILVESYQAIDLKFSWGLFSIYLSEGATFLYYFYCYKEKWVPFIQWKYLPLCFLPLFFMKIEVKGDLFNQQSFVRKIQEKDQLWLTYGCKGSVVDYKGPEELKDQSQIEGCGFKENKVFFDENYSIHNHTNKIVHVRLHEIIFLEKNINDLFKSLIILKPNESKKLALEQNKFYLYKSIQQKKIGIQLLIPKKTKLVKSFSVNPYEVNYVRN